MICCYHHNDLDGRTAGWLVHRMAAPMALEDFPVNYVECDYNTKMDKHQPNDDVFIVDLSISEPSYSDFLKVCETARSVTYIDHHKSTVDTFANHEKELQRIKNLTYFVDSSVSGAALTYIYFSLDKHALLKARKTEDDETYKISVKNVSFLTTTDPKHDFCKFAGSKTATVTYTRTTKTKLVYENEEMVKLSPFVSLVDDYDCWKQQIPESNFFMLGAETLGTELYEMKAGVFNFRDWFWSQIDNDSFIQRLVDDGTTVKKYIDMQYKKELKSAFIWGVDGKRILCKNDDGNSWAFQDEIKHYDACMLFNFDGSCSKWSFSIYSDEYSTFDCEDFAKKYGGGGHLHAAGFSAKELPFDITQRPSYLDDKKK